MGYWCNDDQTEVTVHDTWFAKGYLCDTHTGVAVNALEQYTKETGDETPCVVVSTASPFKFAPALLPALDLDFEGTTSRCWRPWRSSPVCPPPLL